MAWPPQINSGIRKNLTWVLNLLGFSTGRVKSTEQNRSGMQQLVHFGRAKSLAIH